MSDYEMTCPACRGTGTGRYDTNEGRREPCDHCDGSGHVVPCMQCGHDVAAPEAEEHGEFCRGCRLTLDMAPVAEGWR